MTQVALFEGEIPAKPVNVASVPHRSPFRYPGGKTWLVPTIRKWLGSRPFVVSEFVEPFAGGAIVGLTCAAEELVKGYVTLVEKDPDIAAVWHTILGGEGRILADAIPEFDLTHENVLHAISDAPRSTYHRALATLIRNRVSRGGILAPGAGIIKNGENGKGIRSRWYPETLQRRIQDIRKYRSRLRFIEGDAFVEIKKRMQVPTCLFFIDPPYVVAGRRLYAYSEIDHSALFTLLSRVRGEFLMTYDDTEEIRSLAKEHAFEMRRVLMKNTHHHHKKELLIARDLAWFGPSSAPLSEASCPGQESSS